MDPDFRNYAPDPALIHRDRALISLENKVGKLVARGLSLEAIAADLKLPRAVVEAIIARNAPTSAARVRRG
jgi:hypothetical protein